MNFQKKLAQQAPYSKNTNKITLENNNDAMMCRRNIAFSGVLNLPKT
jgi:hypothetical protein